MTNNIIFHVGYPKTASTFLQNKIFPKLRNVKYFPLKPEDARLAMPDISMSLGRLYNYLDNPQASENQGIEEVIAAVLAKLEPDNFNLFSSEGLIGIGNKGVDNSSWRDRATLLKEIFGDARVLIVLREQYSFLESLYYFNPGGHSNFGAWFEEMDDRYDLTGTLSYSEVVDYYFSLFGKERVHVLVYEEMTKNISSYEDQLSLVLGEKVSLNSNERLSRVNSRADPSNKFKRIRARFGQLSYSRYFPRPIVASGRSLLWFAAKMGVDPKLKLPNIEEIEAIRERYAKSNLELERMLNRPISEIWQ